MFLATAAAWSADLPRESVAAGDIDVAVTLDPVAQGGRADATVRIHARREVVWRLLTSCSEALAMVPGLVGCRVLETAPDGSWQLIRHVMNYSWLVPGLTYDIRARYEPPERVLIERVSGDLKLLKVSWSLSADGVETLARYQVDLIPGFWVPQWLQRVALKRDLPKMLRTLRSRAEVAAASSHD